MLCLSDLSIKFQLNVLKVLSFKLAIHPNCHASAELKGVFQSEENLMKYQSVHEDTPITVSADQTILFAGVVVDLKIMQANGACNFWMRCSSSTIAMDKKRNYKSDQDIQITYHDMIQSRVQQYDGGCYVNYADSLEGSIGAPVYQYDETDWEFAMRAASYGGAVLYPNPYRTEPYFQSAFEKDGSNVHHLDETFCNIINNSDGLGFEATSEYAYRVGEKVLIHNRHLWITEVDVWTEHENLVFQYKIGQVPKSRQQWNARIIGALLKGTVIGRENNCIKLHFDIDDEQPENTAFFYEYKPLTVSGLYAIPEKGTQAMLYFPDQNVSSEYAVENLYERTDGAPPDKEFKTIDNEFLLMHPGVITFTNGEGTFNATLSSGLIQIDTDGDLNVESKKSIRLEAGRQVVIQAGEDLHIRKADGKKGNIRLNDEVNISGEQFLIHSEPCALTPIPQKTPEPDGVDFNQVDAAKAITGSTPQMINANYAASSGISPVAMVAGTLVSACSPATMSAKTFSLTNKPRVQTKPVVKVLGATTDKAAIIFVNGEKLEGYIKSEKPYINKSEKMAFIKAVQKSHPKFTGFNPSESIEIAAKAVKFPIEKISRWHDTEDMDIVVFNPMMLNAGVQVVRIKENITIDLFVEFIGDKDVLIGGKKLKDLAISGINLWNGTYSPRANANGYYDYFGVDDSGTPISVILETRIHEGKSGAPVTQQQYVKYEFIENRLELVESNFCYTSFIALTLKAKNNIWACRPETQIRVKMVTHYASKLYDYDYKNFQFERVVTHETGHVFGLFDAYNYGQDGDLAGGYRGANNNLEETRWNTTLFDATKGDIMGNDGKITANNIEMILEALKYNVQQHYISWSDKDDSYAKSEAVRTGGGEIRVE